MREHTHLPAMVGFVREHVAQHFRANGPRPSPAVSAKLLDAATRTAERFREHLRAASGALGQSRTGLPRRAVRAVELWWNLEVRSCKPDPLRADVVHVREDRRNGAGVAGRFGFPGARVEMLDKKLVHALIGGKDLDCGSAELRVNLGLARGHGSLLLDLQAHHHKPRDAAATELQASAFVPCVNKDPLARFFIFNDVLTRPVVAKFSHASCCIFERRLYLDELQGSIALHVVNAKVRSQANSDWGQPNQEGTVERSSHGCDLSNITAS
jgi:hypothetical protein